MTQLPLAKLLASTYEETFDDPTDHVVDLNAAQWVDLALVVLKLVDDACREGINKIGRDIPTPTLDAFGAGATFPESLHSFVDLIEAHRDDARDEGWADAESVLTEERDVIFGQDLQIPPYGPDIDVLERFGLDVQAKYTELLPGQWDYDRETAYSAACRPSGAWYFIGRL